MVKSGLPTFDPRDFGDFTRDRVVSILKKADLESPIVNFIAVTLLASLDPRGPGLANDLVATALDVLANTHAPIGQGLLWQAAEHAQNARIRVEAIRRSGSTATPEQSALLRKWATEGFQPIVNFQHDSIDRTSIREAAITALGTLKEPTDDDIETILLGLTVPSNQEEFSKGVFNASYLAYWLVGDAASLPKLVTLVSKRWRGGAGISLLSLAGKFSAEELGPHADELRSVFLQLAREWPSDDDRVEHLLTLAEKLCTPKFFQDWASQYGGHGLEHGCGQVAVKLFQGFSELTEVITKGFLTLAQSSCNIPENGPVLRVLRQCISAGYGGLVSETIIPQSHEGYRQLVESGSLVALYDSIDAAMVSICEALSSNQNEHELQRIAATVATGILNAACAGKLPSPNAGRKARGHNTEEAEKAIADKVSLISELDRSQNPILIVARLLYPPVSSLGAVAIVERWLSHGDPLAQYVIQCVVHEAGQANVFGQESPMLTRFEQCVLPMHAQQLPMKPALETALVQEIVVDERLNRYALDLMQRKRLSFEKGAEMALSRIQTKDDADFLLDRLHNERAIDILAKSSRFHRDGNESVTIHVQARAILLLTELLKQTSDRHRLDGFATQLHDRFQDLPTVRESAYRACGELGCFSSIRPLRERLSREKSASGRTVIEQAIGMLRQRLIEEKPQQGQGDIKQWLEFVADLGDPTLVPLVSGYLDPPHADHAVRQAALNALEHMISTESLGVVRKFVDGTAPEGETLSIARHARLVLEQRHDSNLFDVLGNFYTTEDDVLDPAIDYVAVFGGSVLAGVTKGLKKSQQLFKDGHWDEFVTRISSVMEAVARQVIRCRFGLLGMNAAQAEKLAKGPYHNLLNFTAFHNTYGILQTHCNTIYAYRGESSTAHATHTDGSTKAEATEEDAEYVRDEFKLAFAEAVKVLR